MLHQIFSGINKKHNLSCRSLFSGSAAGSGTAGSGSSTSGSGSTIGSSSSASVSWHSSSPPKASSPSSGSASGSSGVSPAEAMRETGFTYVKRCMLLKVKDFEIRPCSTFLYDWPGFGLGPLGLTSGTSIPATFMSSLIPASRGLWPLLAARLNKKTSFLRIHASARTMRPQKEQGAKRERGTISF